ncbi:MAG: hypothetical protein JWP31_1691 [Aeromicrobium sp.]|nr:hypothetical protein [Aeromicrobium sp.]
MNHRMTMTTALIAATLTLAGCTSDSDGTAGDDDVSSPTASPTPTPTPAISTQAPAVDPDTDGAVAVRGDWRIAAEDYVLHLIEDGTFVEDFMGIEDFRTGKYNVKGSTISLVGDDGNTDKGKIVDETLVFTLGTATRVK